MRFPAVTSALHRLVRIALAASLVGACAEQTSKPSGPASPPETDSRRLEPVGGIRDGDGATAEQDAASGNARLADEDMVADAAEQRDAVSATRSAPQPQPKPEPPAPVEKPVVKAESPKPKPAKPPAKGQKIYVAQRGDSLWKIAQQQYGDGRAWRKIYNANRTRIADPRDVPIGTKLVIP